MKIAFIYDVIYPYVKGGAEKRNWELAQRLSSRGHEVHLFGMKSWQGPGSFVREGVYLHGVCQFQRLYLASGIRNPFGVLCFTACIIPALLRNKFNIIDCSAFPYLPFFTVKMISRIKTTPLVVTWQEVWGDYWHDYLGYFWGGYARLIEKTVIRFSGKVIAHSLKVKRTLINNGARQEDITVIAHGIDLQLVENAPLSAVGLDLIFAGRLIKEKNANLIIESLGEIKKTLPAVKCLIVGEGPEKNRLIRLRNKFGLENNLIFKDFIQGLAKKIMLANRLADFDCQNLSSAQISSLYSLRSLPKVSPSRFS